MDISLFSIQPILIISLLFALIFTKVFNKRKPSHKTNLPPGSFGWPFLGETYQFLHEKPEKFLGDRMKKYSSKIFKTKLFGEPTVVLCGVEGNKFIATNEGRLLCGWRTPGMQTLFRSSGYQKSSSSPFPRTKEVQITRAPGFLEPKALAQYASVMDATVQGHLETYWLGKESVKAFDLALLLNLTLASRFFAGLEDQVRILKLAKLLHYATLGMHSTGIDFPGTIFHRAKKSADAAKKEILQIIKEKKAEISGGGPMRDILSHMILNTESSDSFTSENEIASKIMGLLVAGFSSPAIALACTLKLIGERPDIYQNIRQEQMEISRTKNSSERLNWEDIRNMKYSWNVMMEVMRLVPPLQGTFREATTDFTYEGHTVPKGWKIYWTVSTTNMDPNCFPNPKLFDPTRFDKENVPPPYSNIPFGGGPRVCPGKEFTRMAMLTSLHHIVKAFKWDVVVPDEKMVGTIIPIPAQGVPLRLHTQPPQ